MDITLSSESGMHQAHDIVDGRTARFPFAIQHLLGIDAARQYYQHHHRHRDVISPITLQQQPLPMTTTTSHQPSSGDDVTCQVTTCYRRTDAMLLDDVISAGRHQQSSSLPTHRLAAAASLTELASPASVLPALTDVSGKRTHDTPSTCLSASLHLRPLAA